MCDCECVRARVRVRGLFWCVGGLVAVFVVWWVPCLGVCEFVDVVVR